jgi:phenol 2-monooxygenase
MQYHLDGFHPGDPEVSEAADGRPKSDPGFVAPVDVLIVGTGPAGLTLAAQLAAFPDITTRIVECRPGPMEKGQADGIACRYDGDVQRLRLCREDRSSRPTGSTRSHVLETGFEARPKHIVRSGRIQDVEDGLSEISSHDPQPGARA